MEDTLGNTPLPDLLTILAAEDAAGSGSVLAVLASATVVVVLSAFASMTEAAFLSLSRLKAHEFEESENRLERLAGKLRLNFAEPLATIVVVNNIANIAGSLVTGVLASSYFEAMGWPVKLAAGVFSAVLTLVVILAGEIIPKTIGETYRWTIVKYAAVPIRFLQTVLHPIIWLASKTQKPFLRGSSHHVTSEEEIVRLASLGQEQGSIEEQEGEMIQRVFQLNDTYAEDIMTPRMELVMLAAGSTLASVADELGETRFSRVPLYGDTRDHIVRVLDRMDALLALANGRGDLLLADESISFEPYIAPESMPADDLLVELKRRTEPMAVVVGEYGESLGVVTLDDVLEELVGDIRDEEDEANEGTGIFELAEGELEVEGRAEIKDVNELFGLEIPNHRTVAGLLLDELERIPSQGETLEIGGVAFTVTEVSERAILKVHLRRVEAPPPELAGVDAAD